MACRHRYVCSVRRLYESGGVHCRWSVRPEVRMRGGLKLRKVRIYRRWQRWKCKIVLSVGGWFNTFGCLVYGGVAEVEVGEGLGALDRKSALYVGVYVVDRRSCVNGLRKCDIKMIGVGIDRNLSVELHIVQRQVHDCYTAMKRQRKCAWPVQRETWSPHWQSFEITRKLSLMWSLPRNSCVVVVNGSFDAG